MCSVTDKVLHFSLSLSLFYYFPYILFLKSPLNCIDCYRLLPFLRSKNTLVQKKHTVTGGGGWGKKQQQQKKINKPDNKKPCECSLSGCDMTFYFPRQNKGSVPITSSLWSFASAETTRRGHRAKSPHAVISRKLGVRAEGDAR